VLKFPVRLFALPALLAAVMLAACASTELVNQWSNPAYTSSSFKRVMVIGVARQASIRRTFEDEFVTPLRVASLDAVPSHQYIPERASRGGASQASGQAGQCGRRDHHATHKKRAKDAGDAGLLPGGSRPPWLVFFPVDRLLRTPTCPPV
jgi:hypothetical protein